MLCMHCRQFVCEHLHTRIKRGGSRCWRKPAADGQLSDRTVHDFAADAWIAPAQNVRSPIAESQGMADMNDTTTALPTQSCLALAISALR